MKINRKHQKKCRIKYCHIADKFGRQTRVPNTLSSSQGRTEHIVNTAIHRFFDRTFSKPALKSFTSNKLPLTKIQQGMRHVINDCSDLRCRRMSFRINQAQTPADLWALRSDLHQCIAQLHTESEAALRINDMASMFEGWIPAAQLIKIQPDFRPSRH